MSVRINWKHIDNTVLTPIALEILDIKTLIARNSDCLDFHELSVWGVRRALRQSYCAGHSTCMPMAKALRILIKSCEEALSGDWDKSDAGFVDMIELASQVLAQWEGGSR